MQPDTKDGGPDEAPQARRTPNTDMQAEDAGTPDSGTAPDAGSETGAEPAIKQTSKPESDTGSRG